MAYQVGQAPWETKKPTAQTSFAVGKAPWEDGTEEPQPIAPNYLDRVGTQYSQFGQDVLSGIQAGAEQIASGTSKGGLRGAAEAAGGVARAGLRTVGTVARAALTPILETPAVKKATEFLAEKVSEIPQAQELIRKATDLALKHPGFASDLRDIVDIATLGAGGTAERPLIQGAQRAAFRVQGALTPSEDSIQRSVISLFNKSIKPTAKKTLQQTDRYNNSVINALRTIKSNTDQLNIEDATGEIVTGRTPQTINELAQALDQTKKTVFTQYDALAKQAGKGGAAIDATKIADEVGQVVQNKALKLSAPEIINYAQSWEKRLRDFGAIDAETAQEVVKIMNGNLQAFYKNPTYDAASRVTIDAGIANNFRQALDEAIESATGAQYQALKNQYAALKAIESDVVRAALREGRKNTKGLLDYSDIFTGGQMIGGILSLNPAMFTKGAIERGIKEYIKFLNDPNRAVANMFDKISVPTAARPQ